VGGGQRVEDVHAAPDTPLVFDLAQAAEWHPRFRRPNPKRQPLMKLCTALIVSAAAITPAPLKAEKPGAQRPDPPWWQKATAAKSYAAATAWEPRFDDKALWPQLTGKEKFLKEPWPKGRMYVWATPGKDGDLHGRRRTSLDPTKPAQWIDAATGKPATKLILDKDTDLYFPASKAPYRVGFRTTDVRERLRHLTVEPGAAFVGGGDGAGRTIHGNVWVKKGGAIYAQGGTAFVGDKHTFVRNDNVNGQGSQYFNFNKQDASVEFLGHITTSDEWRHYGGTVIVGPDSVMQPGRAATPRINAGAKLVLLDGAYWGKWCNEWQGPVDLDVRGGTVQAGLPERPLTRDATLALSIRNWAGLEFKAWSGQGKDHSTRKVSALFRKGATVRVIAAPGSGARLVITRYELGGPYNGGGRAYMHHVGEYGTYPRQSERKKGKFAEAKFRAEFDSRPHKTLIYIAKGVTIDGPVRLDHFPPGGILCEDPAERAAWKDLSFGANNLARGDELFVKHAPPAKNGDVGDPPASVRRRAAAAPAASAPAGPK
jgi:hypothetical protein